MDHNEMDDIDEEIEALIPAYLANRIKDLFALKEALEKKDLEAIKKLAHKIKGTALSYGQKSLDKIVCDLENACLNMNWQEIEKSLAAMEVLLSNKNGH